MATQPINTSTPSRWVTGAKRLARKLVILTVLGVVFGLVYDWAVPRLYKPESRPGFRMGILHGALMPVALPALLMGQDVPIYATNNGGRFYNIGYICGINLCGLLFFGTAFGSPPGAGKT